ncbi:uncharacterized protein MKK02DRAFT_30789 [Dioszegia hungarica]|uniref:Homeobox domain-containing protein n=1 Tax=Dioszegia hungarica TaxID=4972 RepID=A0AA38LRR9_9TREE|nr:uncharacterized protein MKK02DRAFT_30789 [Dioszegia hungarica]KAI9631784.1 hypothetical protein MKK02DRAFT_30789 [Dioszegia hungarica]
MLEQLSNIIRDADRIATTCQPLCQSEYGSKLRRGIDTVQLKPTSLAPSVLTILQSATDQVRLGVLRLFDQHVHVSEQDVQVKCRATLEQLVSVEGFGGMSDAMTEQLVCEAFEREHMRRVGRINQEIASILQAGHSEQKPGRESSTFTARTVSILESAFQRKSLINNAETIAIAQLSGITPIQVRTWFQNRRNRQRKAGRPVPSTPYHPPSSDTSDDSDPTPQPSSPQLSALPRRHAQNQSSSRPLPTPPTTSYSSSEYQHTTPTAHGNGRRVKAMPRRAYPPEPSASRHYPQMHPSGKRGLSPAPSMARSLSAQSSVSDVSSVDPSGGFNSLLISPHDAPTQVTMPGFFTPLFDFNMGMGDLNLGAIGAGAGASVDTWSFNLNPPQAAEFEIPDSLAGLDFDLMQFNFPEFTLEGMGASVGGGQGGEGGDGAGMGGLGIMDGLTLAGTPSFTDSTSGSPTRPIQSTTTSHPTSTGQAGLELGLGLAGNGEGDGGLWTWDGSIAEQMAALFEAEGKHWLAEGGAQADIADAQAQAQHAEQAEQKEQGKKGIERGISLDDIASPPHARSRRVQARARSESRSVTPPPIPRFTTTAPTPTQPTHAYSHSTLAAHPFIPLPAYNPAQSTQAQAEQGHGHGHSSGSLDFSAHSLPGAPHPLYAGLNSAPSAASADQQQQQAQSRVSSFGSVGSGTSVGSSVRIITPPSGEYAFYPETSYHPTHPVQQYAGSDFAQSSIRATDGTQAGEEGEVTEAQGKKGKGHARTASMEGFRTSSWSAPAPQAIYPTPTPGAESKYAQYNPYPQHQAYPVYQMPMFPSYPNMGAGIGIENAPYPSSSAGAPVWAYSNGHPVLLPQNLNVHPQAQAQAYFHPIYTPPTPVTASFGPGQGSAPGPGAEQQKEGQRQQQAEVEDHEVEGDEAGQDGWMSGVMAFDTPYAA